jgi:hypothetical protein
VLVDGKVVASGVREARVLDLAPGASHALRVEAVDRAPHEQTFHGRRGASRAGVSLVPAGRHRTSPAVQHAKRRDTPAAAKTAPTTPPPATTSKPRHRDGLVGDDIFENK